MNSRISQGWYTLSVAASSACMLRRERDGPFQNSRFRHSMVGGRLGGAGAVGTPKSGTDRYN
jgi:hypothetical protein